MIDWSVKLAFRCTSRKLVHTSLSDRGRVVFLGWLVKFVCWCTSRKLVHTSLSDRGSLSVGVQVGNLYIRGYLIGEGLFLITHV